MKFSESGLKNNALVEEAFNYSYDNMMSSLGENLQGFTQQVNLVRQQELDLLEADKKAGTLTEEQYKREKEALIKMLEQQLKMGPEIVGRELKNIFKGRRLDPALEIEKYSDNKSAELVAAVLLIETVRSPIDYQHVEQKFGPGVAGLIAEVHHIDAYPSERDTNLSKAGSDTKRAYMALLVSNLNQVSEQIQRLAQQKGAPKFTTPPGQEETLFKNAKNLWGNDKKLDQRFLESFNKMAQVTASAFRLEVSSTDGSLELIKDNLIPPGGSKPKPPGPGKKPGDLGDDVF